MALKGADITDKEYIDMLNLDANLEGKPEINEAIAEAVKLKNMQTYMEQGLDEDEAAHKAGLIKDQVLHDIKKYLLKTKTKKK